MRKITFLIVVLFLVICPIYINANYIPGAFNNWAQNTAYSTENMPQGFKRYSVKTSNDAQFKLLRLNNNWNEGWGSGYRFNNWNVVWTVNYSNSLSTAQLKEFGTNQWMSIITSTSLAAVNSKFGFLKTSASPIYISSLSGGTTNVNLNTSATINITLSAEKCIEEFVLIRYTTDDWSTSSFVTATGSGTSYSATIPAQIVNSTIKWYAMTSTIEKPTSDTDYLTLSVMNNSGNNYTYYTGNTGNSSDSDHFRSKQTGNWDITSNWESSPDNTNWVTSTLVPGSSASSITILTGHNITLDNNVTIPGLTINSGATLVINETQKLTVATLTNNGTITNNGTLTLKTGNTNPPTLLNNNSMSGSGVYEVEQSLASGRQWWYLSSPLSGAYTGTVFSGSQVGIYDEDAFNYTAPFASSTLMSVGLGHVIKFPNTDARTITFTGGSLNNGNITITPTRTGTTEGKRGFNLIGNPYPSYIDWDAIYHDATNPATNMRDAIWFRTYSSGMTFHTYSDGEAVPTSSGVTAKIAPMQGFWVKVDADGSNGSLTFKNTHRLHYASGYNPLKVKAADDRQRVRLVLSDGTNSDETLIVGKSYASDSQDAYDIEKMSNESADISEIYSMIGTETMVINSVAPITAGKTVALGIRSTSEKAYSITASQLQNIPTDVRVVLVDAEDESETELSEGVSYNFVAPAGAVNNRFSIQFRSPGATTQVDNDSKNKILVYSNSQQQIEIISTESLPAGTQIRVFNAAGQTIAQMQAAGNRISIPASISKGVYFCHIENANQNLQYKVIVR